ncbi:hypothetical protein BC936DRAFT_139032, partial [Jimgerdemannia flammicorona]
RNYLLTFLTEDEFLSLNSIFGSAINGWNILAPAAERCLQTLAKLNDSQLQSIGRIVLIEGVRGAVKQTLHLVGNAMASVEPSLNDDESDNDGKNIFSRRKTVTMPTFAISLICCDIEYTAMFILRVLDYIPNSRPAVRCWTKGFLREIIRNGTLILPSRHIYFPARITSLINTINTHASSMDHSSGEIVSRASRNRRTLAIGASKNAEGYHVDWLFSRHDLSKDSVWGREFSLCERAGSTVENRQKISSDTMKVQKTLRDMHQSLYDAITEAGNGALSKSVSNQTTKLLMPGFISSYFFVRILLVLYVGAGFYASLDLAEFDIPTTTKEIENILKAARIMLQIKVSDNILMLFGNSTDDTHMLLCICIMQKIMVSTVARFRKMKERAIQEKFGGENVVIHGRQPEPVTPKKK